MNTPWIHKVFKKIQLNRPLEETALRTRRLYEVSLQVTKQRKVQVLAEVLVEGARQLIRTEGAFVFLIDSEQAVVNFLVSAGIQIDRDIVLGQVRSTGLFGLAYIERQPVSVEAPEQHPLWKTTPVHRPCARQLLSVPLIHREKVGGVLTVINKLDTEAFSTEDMDTLSTLAVYAAVAIDNARFMEEVETIAITDSLTGLYNHREFQKRLMEEIERGKRYGKEFSLLMLDMDHFKVINDTHGHPVGDAVLKETAKIIKKSVRNVDLPARYGGEEFAVILPETSGEQAKKVAERIRKAIDQSSFAIPDGHPVHLSISVGIASFPLDADSREGLIISADEALYFAKERGRNKVCSYHETFKSAIEKNQGKLAELLHDPRMKTIRDLAAAVDAKSPYTRGHTEAVVQYSLQLAEALNLSEGDQRSLQLASLFHNIGMVSIPDTLLNKPGPLSIEEQKIIQAHPSLAQMLIRESAQLEPVLPAILYHHERYDGKGYPNGLEGEEIPFLARVLGVVEAYHAMISIRPYRRKLTPQQAIEELKRNSGHQFDPRVVEAFVKLLKDQE